MRIDSSGRVGIGTNNPDAKLVVAGGSEYITNTSGNIAGIEMAGNGNTPTTTSLFIGQGSTGLGFLYQRANSDLLFGTNNGERMRIRSTGRIGTFGTTNDNGSLNLVGEGSGSYKAISFERTSSGGEVGNVVTNASTTSYNTSSDYRLKENVNYNFDATTRLKQLKPARFNFITEPDNTVDGFLAHEVQSVIPEAITGIKDETETREKVVVNANGKVIAQNIEQADWEAGKIPNEEGKSQYPIDSTWEASKVVPVYQGIDQAKLTPILTKALQEAMERIEQLETKNISLEARLTALES
jgi:hypothetical protein